MNFVPDYEEYIALMEVAKGKRKPTLVLRGGFVFNPFTFSVERADVSVWKRWVAEIGGVSEKGEEEVRVDGLYLIPGFIDAHCHPDLFYNPFTFSSFVASLGVTTVQADIHDFSTSVGFSNYLRFIKVDASHLPVKFILTAPIINPPNPGVEGDWVVPDDAVEDLSKCSKVGGISEITSWVNLYSAEEPFLKRIYPFVREGKRIEGHTPGARGKKLSTLSLVGITSDHESTTFDEAVERLKLGWWVMVREGSIRQELSSIAPELSKRPELMSRVMLTADGIFPDHLVEWGYMDFVVRRAVEEGIPVPWAVRMTTLNPAEYLGISRYVGSITPGKVADILAVESLDNPKPSMVFVDGKRYEEGEPCIPEDYFKGRFSLDPSGVRLFASSFGSVPTISVENRTITRLKSFEIRGPEDMERLGCMYITMVHRDTGEAGRGFLHNFGFIKGAFSISVSHEPHHILVIGSRPADMYSAFRRVVENGGGISIFSEGRELFFLDLSVGGTMSPLPVRELSSKIREARDLLKELGSTVDDPLWCAVFLSFTGLPEVRITPKGVFHVKRKGVVYDG